MSIQTAYVKKIFCGEKEWEFRKNILRLCEESNSTIVVYSAGIDKAIVGEFTVKEVVKTTFEELMQLTNKADNKEAVEWLKKYYGNAKLCCAIRIGDVVQYKNPLTLQEIKKVKPNFFPPQNFVYLDSMEEVRDLIEHSCLKNPLTRKGATISSQNSEIVHTSSRIFTE